MKFNYSGLVLLLSAAAVRASPVYSNTLIETLILHGFTSYATGLQSNPELLALLENRNDITIWAPINSAITSSSWVPRQSKGIYRRQSASSYSSTISHSPPSPNTGSIPKREASNTPSNFLRLYTFLNDPEYVNLGEDQPLRHVSNFAAPLPGQSVSRISVRSGGGNTVSQVSGPFKYDGGIIYGVSGFPTLPSPLSAALTTAGLTKFRSAVKAAGLVKSLSDTPRVTIFAPQNSGIRPGFKVLQHTITGDLHLSPDLFSNQPFTSDAGTQITVTFNNGALYANGIKIIRTDLITKNGVVHVLEKAFPNYL